MPAASSSHFWRSYAPNLVSYPYWVRIGAQGCPTGVRFASAAIDGSINEFYILNS
jgi:hypothetical protein